MAIWKGQKTQIRFSDDAWYLFRGGIYIKFSPFVPWEYIARIAFAPESQFRNWIRS